MTTESKLIKSLIPKITEYFEKNGYLQKNKLSEFLDFIDLNIWNSESEIEILWSALNQNVKSEKELQRVILIKNLTSFIHSHDKELFQPEKSLESSVKSYISSNYRPYFSNEAISEIDHDVLFDLYKLLCLVPLSSLSNDKIFLSDIDSILKANTFIKIDTECITNALSTLINKKLVGAITTEDYLNVIENLAKIYKFKNNEGQSAYVFTDEELEEPEDKNYNYILDYVNILFRMKDTLEIIKTKFNSADSKFYFRYYDILSCSIGIFINEIEKVFYEQKQKFDFFNDRNKEVINYLKEEANKNERINTQGDVSFRESAIVDEVNSIKVQNQNLINELEKIKKELNAKEEEVIISNNNLIYVNKTKDEIETKYNLLSKDNEQLNNNYIHLLNQFNRRIMKKEDNTEDTSKLDFDVINKEIDAKLNEEQRNLVNSYHEQLISYIIEKDKYCGQIEEKNANIKKLYEESEKAKQILEKELNEMKILNSTYSQKINTLQSANELLLKDAEMIKSNKGKLLSSLISDIDDGDNLYKIIKNIQILIPSKKKQQIQSSNILSEETKKDFDFLGLKMNESIIQSLDDNYYNTNTNLIFSERIDYIDENKKPINCILLVTQSFLYMFNKSTYEKCFSVPLVDLETINASTNNNLISLTFLSGDIVIFEIFRVLEFINFFNYMNTLEKARNYSININNYNNLFMKDKKKNYTTCPYYGRASLSGYLYKKVEGIVTVNFYERFVILCEIGMIVMDSPLGKPLEIINLLFAETHQYEDKDENPCFEIAIGKNIHVFKAGSNCIRQKWVLGIERWIVETYTEQNKLKKY